MHVIEVYGTREKRNLCTTHISCVSTTQKINQPHIHKHRTNLLLRPKRFLQILHFGQSLLLPSVVAAVSLFLLSLLFIVTYCHCVNSSLSSLSAIILNCVTTG